MVWMAAPLDGVRVAEADGMGGLRGALPAPSPAASPGDALWATAAGARFVAEPGHGPLLGCAVEGAAALRAQPAGATIELRPIEPHPPAPVKAG